MRNPDHTKPMPMDKPSELAYTGKKGAQNRSA
jgi:hypothetical protein